MKQLQSLLDTIPNIVWTASSEGSITFLNRRWAEVTGLSRAQGLGFAFLEVIHPEDRDHIQAVWQQAVEMQCAYEAEFRLRQANQTYHRVIAQARLEIDTTENSSQMPQWVGTFTDIEAVIRAQEDLVNDQPFLAALLLEREQKARAELEAANQQITMIWQSMTDAYITLDCDWRIIYTNPAATAIFRQLVTLAPQDFLGKTHWDVFPWSVGNIVEQEYRRAVTNQVAVHFEVLYEPTEAWFEIHAYPSTEGLGIYFQDISERKRTETERIQAEQERDRFFNLSLDMLAIASFEGYFLSLNPAWEQTLGFTAAELMAQPYLDLVHPEDRAETLTAAQGLKKGQAVLRFENRYRCKDGSYRWLLWSSRPYDEQNLVYAVAHDISERKQVEVALRASERKFSAIFEQTFELMGILSLEGVLLEVNQAALDSISAQKLDLVGRCFWDAPWWHSPQLQNQLKDAITQAASGQFIRYEVQFPNASGDLRITDFSLKPVFDEASRVEMIIAEAHDITDRKQTETALRESEERFRTLADNISQLTWMMDAEGWIFWYNRRWFDYTGTTLEEMQGWGWQQVHHPEHIDRVVEHFRHHLEIGEKWEDTFPLRGKDGAYRWFLSRAIPITDGAGQVLQWFGTNTDITELKQAEESLRQSESRFRQMADTAPVLIWMSGTDKLCYYFNQPWLEFTGRTLAQEVGHGWAEGIHPDDRQRCLDIYFTAFDAQQAFQMEYRHRRFDGEYRWLADSGVPRFTLERDFLGYIGSCVDMTERKEAQDVLEARTHELSHLNNLLAQAAALLDERNQELDSFVHIVSHDLKAPLRAVSNLSQWIEEDLERTTSAEIQPQMALLRNRVNRMEAMISGLLDYARIERTQVIIEQVSVEELLCEVIDSVAPEPTFQSAFLKLRRSSSTAQSVLSNVLKIMRNRKHITQVKRSVIPVSTSPERRETSESSS